MVVLTDSDVAAHANAGRAGDVVDHGDADICHTLVTDDVSGNGNGKNWNDQILQKQMIIKSDSIDEVRFRVFISVQELTSLSLI